MKIAFLGTSEFAVPALQALVDAGHDVVAVYARAPKPAGRGQQERKTPVHRLADGLGLPVRTPKTLKTEDEAAGSLPGADLIVVSPGVDGFAALQAAEAAGVPVIGEIELAARLLSAPLCAIGGTNGKSTTTELVAEMLRRAGRRVFCGGNLGTPLAEAVGESWDALVVEVSSFQLERAPEFRPAVSVLLNITDDHLDRHGSFEAYAHAKGNAFANQGPDDFAVAPFGDAVVERQVRRGQGRVLLFGPEILQRGQPHGTFKFLFNGIYRK